MKSVLVLKDEQAHWATVEHLFREVNAEITPLDIDTEMNLARDARPDLVITGVAGLARLPSTLRRTPRIVLVSGSPGGEPSSPTPERNQQILWWPRDRSKLRELASALLGIALRKKFKTLIRVFSG